MADYKVNVGLSYVAGGEERRAEPGDVATDIPAESVGWLLAGGHISEVGQPKPKKAKEADA